MISKFMKLWLLRSGVEWNPGPKRKAPKNCATCGRITSTSCAVCDYEAPTKVFSQDDLNCSSTTTTVLPVDETSENITQLIQRLTLYSIVTDSFEINAATSEQLTAAGYVFGYYSTPTTTVFTTTDTILTHYTITKMQNVKGDGACLFNALSLALYGNETAALRIRRKVCEQMINLNFTTDQLFVNGSLCNSIEEYLQRSSMRHNFAYGGDVEVCTFANLTKLAVVVFVESILRWVEYTDPETSSFETLPQIFLYLDGNHFQLVTEMSLMTSHNNDTSLQALIEVNTLSTPSHHLLSAEINQPLWPSIQPVVSNKNAATQHSSSLTLKLQQKTSAVSAPKTPQDTQSELPHAGCKFMFLLLH